MIKRTIPSSGEALPIIGLGTWQTFDVSGRAAGMGMLPDKSMREKMVAYMEAM